VRVLVTGMGIQCALGDDTQSLWSAVSKGECGIKPISRFDVSEFDTKLGAMVDAGNALATDYERELLYCLNAAKEALNQSKIIDYSKVSLILGTSNTIEERDINNLSIELANLMNLGGMVFTVSTACTSSTQAIGFAADLIRRGAADYVLSGGIDVLTTDVFAGFHSLGILSQKSCAPFSTDFGTTLGEGAAFIVLESADSAASREVGVIAELNGYGFASDAYHDTKPDPQGYGVARAISSALDNACVSYTDIDYINAHGTGTLANDSSEWRAFQRVFKERSNDIPVSSSKSFLAHGQGAAGSLECVATLMAMNKNVVLPTLNYNTGRTNSPPDVVNEAGPRPLSIDYFVSTNSAFGGVNAALVFSKTGKMEFLPDLKARRVCIESVGSTTDVNLINSYVPQDALRGVDISARLLAGAVSKSLEGAEPDITSQEKIGLFVGQTGPSPGSIKEFDNSIKEFGVRKLSAQAFTRLVVNYACGVSCRLFELKGPISTIATDSDSGLISLVLSIDHLAWHNDTSYLLSAAVGEELTPYSSLGAAESVLLSAGKPGSSIEVTSWAIANNSRNAVSRALKQVNLRIEDIKNIDVTGECTSKGLKAIIELYGLLRKEEKGSFLISSNTENSHIGAALIIEKNEERS
jgi:3-oxoacyl-[acyl-carrier-protein] synthase II